MQAQPGIVMTGIKEVGKQVFSIDDNLYSIPAAGSVYFLAEDKNALIDTGPATSVESVIKGIRQIGFQPENLEYIIITHIHLDHSGGVGTLLQYAPRAKVIAHPRAIKHLIDPSRLVASAIEAEGREFVAGNGEVLPVPEQRLIPANDGDTLNLGKGQALTLLSCPGHAPHELCILESRNRGIFVGDAVGHHIDGTDVMVPITPPPSFDLTLYITTLNRLMSLSSDTIYFAHSGSSNQVQKYLKLARQKLIDREIIIEKAAAENNLESAAEMIINQASGELVWVKEHMRPVYDYWIEIDIPMSAAEHVRYYKKKYGLL
jgi:glyoxylase-like metal-dependent hydrolase (beta-lactamase superfamily II)